LQENLSRFAGGSGHSHPVYYYISYLFSQSLPWSLFLPVLLWDLFRSGSHHDEGALFLKLWFLVMFAFFSISVGKRTVYLLPIYPALSLLFAAWFYHATEPRGTRLLIYRAISLFAGFSGALLLVVTLGALWSHDQGWFYSSKVCSSPRTEPTLVAGGINWKISADFYSCRSRHRRCGCR
jgi:4-amino-4-deoxy-L-arabinose transferase-like glycosyltransferase